MYYSVQQLYLAREVGHHAEPRPYDPLSSRARPDVAR
jgi:hypothetical protein